MKPDLSSDIKIYNRCILKCENDTLKMVVVRHWH